MLQVTPTCITWTSTTLAAAVARRGRSCTFRCLYAAGAVFGIVGLFVALALLAANLAANTLHLVGAGTYTLGQHGEHGTALESIATGAHVDIRARAEEGVWEVKPLIPGVCGV